MEELARSVAGSPGHQLYPVCVMYGTSTHCMSWNAVATYKAGKGLDEEGQPAATPPQPLTNPFLSFCELKYLQSKETLSRVNKGGAAPVVGGAEQGGALGFISLFFSCQELTCV